MTDRSRRILVIDHDKTFVSDLRDRMRLEYFAVEVAHDASTGLTAASRAELVIVDPSVPDSDERDIVRFLRETSDVPIIVVSARTDEASRVRFLDGGADDCVTKPVASDELIARVRAVLRRCAHLNPNDDILECGPLRIDPRSRQVSVEDRSVELSRREFDLLVRLAQDAGRLVLRDALYADVWHESAEGRFRTLDTHIAWLRRKLGRPALISTVIGFGYRLDPTPTTRPDGD